MKINRKHKDIDEEQLYKWDLEAEKLSSIKRSLMLLLAAASVIFLISALLPSGVNAGFFPVLLGGMTTLMCLIAELWGLILLYRSSERMPEKSFMEIFEFLNIGSFIHCIAMLVTSLGSLWYLLTTAFGFKELIICTGYILCLIIGMLIYRLARLLTYSRAEA